MSERISVVVPTHRRPEKLARCLRALAAQDLPREALDVVVVEDGGPTPEVRELCGRGEGGLRLTFVPQAQAGPAAARNRGAREATGDVLAFTDDDCRPRPVWARTLLAAQGGRRERVVGGHTVNAVRANRFSSASQMLVSYITEYGLKKGTPFFASNNFALSRAAFHELGGFDTTFPLAGGEDRELSLRCTRAGFEFVHETDAIIDHDHDLSLRTYWRQHFRYGRGAFRYHQVRAARADASVLRMLAGSLISADPRFYVDLVLFPFTARARRSDTEPGRGLAESMLLLLSQVPNALGFLAERMNSEGTER